MTGTLKDGCASGYFKKRGHPGHYYARSFCNRLQPIGKKHPAKTRFALSGMEFSHDSGHEVAPMEGVGLSGITRTSGACLQKGIKNDTLKEKSMGKWQALAMVKIATTRVVKKQRS